MAGASEAIPALAVVIVLIKCLRDCFMSRIAECIGIELQSKNTNYSRAMIAGNITRLSMFCNESLSNGSDTLITASAQLRHCLLPQV